MSESERKPGTPAVRRVPSLEERVEALEAAVDRLDGRAPRPEGSAGVNAMDHRDRELARWGIPRAEPPT